MCNSIRATKSLIEQIEEPETQSRLTKLEQCISHNCASMGALEKEIQSHFNDGAPITTTDRGTKPLSIPADAI